MSLQIYIRLSRDECATASGEVFSLANRSASDGPHSSAGHGAAVPCLQCRGRHRRWPHFDSCIYCRSLSSRVAATWESGAKQEERNANESNFEADTRSLQYTALEEAPKWMKREGGDSPRSRWLKESSLGKAGAAEATSPTVDPRSSVPAEASAESTVAGEPLHAPDSQPGDSNSCSQSLEEACASGGCSRRCVPEGAEVLGEYWSEFSISGWAQEVSAGAVPSWQFVTAGSASIRLSSKPSRSHRQQRRRQQKQQQEKQSQQQGHRYRFSPSDGCIDISPSLRDSGITCGICRRFGGNVQHAGKDRWAGQASVEPEPVKSCGVGVSRSGSNCIFHDPSNRSREDGDSANAPRCFCTSKSRKAFDSQAARTVERTLFMVPQAVPRGVENEDSLDPTAHSELSLATRQRGGHTSHYDTRYRISMLGSRREAYAAAASATAAAAPDSLPQQRSSSWNSLEWRGLASFASDAVGFSMFSKVRSPTNLSLLLLLDLGQIQNQYARQRARWGTVDIGQKGHHDQHRWTVFTSNSLTGAKSQSTIKSCDQDENAPADKRRTASVFSFREDKGAQSSEGNNASQKSSNVNSNNGSCIRESSVSISSSRDSSRGSSRSRSLYLHLGTAWLWRSLRALGRTKESSRMFSTAELRAVRVVSVGKAGMIKGRN